MKFLHNMSLHGFKNQWMKECSWGILKVSCKGGYKELLLHVIEGTTVDELMQNWMSERMDENQNIKCIARCKDQELMF